MSFILINSEGTQVKREFTKFERMAARLAGLPEKIFRQKLKQKFSLPNLPVKDIFPGHQGG